MAKVTYKPRDPADSSTTRVFGRTFEANKAVEITDENTLRKLENNPHFQVSGSKTSRQTLSSADDGGDEFTEPGSAPSLAQSPNYPPGVGDKTAPPFVITPKGESLPADVGTRQAEQFMREQSEDSGSSKRGGSKSK